MSTENLGTVTPLPDPLQPLSQDALPIEQPEALPEAPQKPAHEQPADTPKDQVSGASDC